MYAYGAYMYSKEFMKQCVCRGLVGLVDSVEVSGGVFRCLLESVFLSIGTGSTRAATEIDTMRQTV